MADETESLYQQMGGFDAILGITKKWHELCLQDPDAAHPFEHDLHPQHDERLAAYLAEAFGGPKLYTAGYGNESYVQRLHAGNGIHEDLDEACLRQFEKALKDVGAPALATERAARYFRGETVEQRRWAASANEVPDGLPMNLAD